MIRKWERYLEKYHCSVMHMVLGLSTFPFVQIGTTLQVVVNGGHAVSQRAMHHAPFLLFEWRHIRRSLPYYRLEKSLSRTGTERIAVVFAQRAPFGGTRRVPLQCTYWRVVRSCAALLLRRFVDAEHVSVGRAEGRNLSMGRVLNRTVEVPAELNALGDHLVHVFDLELQQGRIARRDLGLGGNRAEANAQWRCGCYIGAGTRTGWRRRSEIRPLVRHTNRT